MDEAFFSGAQQRRLVERIGAGDRAAEEELASWFYPRVFATLVASRLAPGGSILVADHHPIWEVLAVQGPGQLTVTADSRALHRPLGGANN